MNTFFHSLNKILLRDIDKLEKEIAQYPNEESIWKLSGEIKNSAGTLCLHLCGNLQHYIGVGLGKSGYKRDRDNEFAARNISRERLLLEIRAARTSVEGTLSNLDASILETEYPLPVFDKPMTVQFFMIHLAAHLEYHLGQVNYHRRLLGGGVVR
jgi:uncharacterized damage-inducible protein DinB